MIDLNLNEFLLLWGAYGITLTLATGLGYLTGWLKAKEMIKMEVKGGNKK